MTAGTASRATCAARFALAVSAVVLPLSVSPDGAVAQDAPPPEQGEALRPDTRHPDVYLRDSFEAEEWIAEARRHAGRGDWAAASSKLCRVIEVHADKLTRTAAGRYVSIPQQVCRLVASWPPASLQSYRRAAEPEAQQQLAEARLQQRIEPLLAVADCYFCTSSGAEAADLVGQMALEAGDFPLAVRMYRRLSTEHPDRAALRANARPRLAIAYALAGRAGAAREVAAETADDPQMAAVTWMGESRPLAPLIESLLAEVQPAADPAPGFSWPVFCGDSTRNRTVDMSIDQLADLWRLEQIGDASLVPEEDRSNAFARAISRGRFLAMNAVVADDTVFIQDSQRVWALQVRSGQLAWRYDGFAQARNRSFPADTELPRWYSPTVSGSRVYACLGHEVVSYYGYEPPESSSTLVCLDSGTGREVWRADRSSLGPAFDEMDFEASPIVCAGKVYVVARRKRTFGFEDCFLYRFDAADGTVEFRTHLGSASTGGFGYRRSTLTIPTLVDDTVYLASNLGTVAAVDRHSGRVRWLRLYERISETQWRREGRGSPHGIRPWEFNPLICAGEKLYALPTDATFLLVLDRTTGDVLHNVSLDQLAGIQSLLGVDGCLIYGVGDEAFCYDLEAGAMLWRAGLPDGEEPLGRGVLTEQQLLVPTRTNLCALGRGDGGVTAQPWDTPGGGNLLAVPGQLLVAG
ncbi:MAG: outer membrane protein assembly factor BamB family protein, partial [Planctomycetota bacterium]